jgi:hypothetical protein
MSANSVAEEDEDPLRFVELKSELEVCSWPVAICNFHLSVTFICFWTVDGKWNTDIS